MKISIIIPAYNSQSTIAQCLSSLLVQVKKPDEIIVIDDGSTDNTAKQVKKFNQVKLLEESHQGPAAARNLGASKAKGDILVFIDSDMEFDPDFLVQLTQPIKLKKTKGTWSSYEWVKNWDNVWARCWNYNQNKETARMVGDSRGQKKVFRAILKSEFDKVRGFDQIGYTDDWTLVAKLGYQPKATTAKLYHHNPANLSRVFNQSRWIGKRQYKLGIMGTLLTIIKANPLFSLITGLIKSLQYRTPHFLVFKLVFDLGIILGATASLFGKKY